MEQKVTYTSRENLKIQKMKSVLTFSKWTKKMSKNDLTKMSLLTEIFYDDLENLSSQINPNIFYLLLYFFYKNLKIFSQWKYMEILGNKFYEKNECFFCEKCNFNCRFISDWNRHLSTLKHTRQCQKEMSGNVWKQDSVTFTSQDRLSCEKCNRQFRTPSGLWKHKKKCLEITNKQYIEERAKTITDKDELIMFLIKECNDYKNMLIEQQGMMMKVIENGVGNNSHNNSNNNHSNNKTFNLQVFLNETCKDAMNITDFVDSIKLQLHDLEKFAEVGYVEGISSIISSNLKTLDVTQRPVHCTDKKRETMYIKDENEWKKEDENKTKLRKAIQYVSNKNIKLLPAFREKYPDYKNSSSKTSDKYDKMVIEAMTTDPDKEDKIIRNISNITTIDKMIKEK